MHAWLMPGVENEEKGGREGGREDGLQRKRTWGHE